MPEALYFAYAWCTCVSACFAHAARFLPRGILTIRGVAVQGHRHVPSGVTTVWCSIWDQTKKKRNKTKRIKETVLERKELPSKYPHAAMRAGHFDVLYSEI